MVMVLKGQEGSWACHDCRLLQQQHASSGPIFMLTCMQVHRQWYAAIFILEQVCQSRSRSDAAHHVCCMAISPRIISCALHR